jgi:hypothetical protein
LLRHTRFETRGDEHNLLGAIAHERPIRELTQRNKEVVVLIFPPVKVEVARPDADHDRVTTIETDRSPDDVWLTAELALPKPIAEDDYMRAARSIFFLGERAAHGEIDLECSEKICGDGATNHTDWLAFARNDSAHRQSRGEIRKNALLRTPIQKIWERNGPAWRFPGSLGDREKLLRSWKRKRFQKHTIDDAENGGVRANAERERNYGNDSKARIFYELSNRVAKIV